MRSLLVRVSLGMCALVLSQRAFAQGAPAAPTPPTAAPVGLPPPPLALPVEAIVPSVGSPRPVVFTQETSVPGQGSQLVPSGGGSQPSLLIQETTPPQPALSPAGTPPPAVAAGGIPDGQWVYTQQYQWLWMPFADGGVTAPLQEGGDPSMYVYSPDGGWRWVAAPWVLGIGVSPSFGASGPGRYSWYGHSRFGRPWAQYKSGRPAGYHGMAVGGSVGVVDGATGAIAAEARAANARGNAAAESSSVETEARAANARGIAAAENPSAAVVEAHPADAQGTAVISRPGGLPHVVRHHGVRHTAQFGDGARAGRAPGHLDRVPEGSAVAPTGSGDERR